MADFMSRCGAHILLSESQIETRWGQYRIGLERKVLFYFSFIKEINIGKSVPRVLLLQAVSDA